ncbi:phosphotransferase [Microlunatus sp. Gsoil 973]|uniref:phosphotransferase n=1 Tax=Microlunatus sp. Gsoil 973 TaxID=2672569 RepID=UPI0012B4B0EC|nr:phosphotransferase [Microlunatus sp. Gsoil 973]QGN35075.1 phosphotransferase [Microlunatus sp. Gsoil 973]
MPGAPLRPDQHRDELIRLARADGLESELTIDLDNSEFKIGWENVVLDSPDGWIVRFPRDDEVPFHRELRLLARLHDRLPARIPAVVRTGRSARYAVYRRLDGAVLDLKAFEAADPLVRDRVAAPFGRFLAAMHDAFSRDEITALDVPAADQFGDESTAERLPAAVRSRYQEVRALVADRLASGAAPPVLLHNDFHLGNLVLDAPLGRLAGVWDFSCVATGDPSVEFRYLVGDSRELAARIASAYAARTGREIDLGLAAAVLKLEEVSDALEEGRDPVPYLT